MPTKTERPDPSDLAASLEWIRMAFLYGVRDRVVLRQVERCLREVAYYERSLLLTKGNILAILERWDELELLLVYLSDKMKGDPEVTGQIMDFHVAHGRWGESLGLIRQLEGKVGAGRRLEMLYQDKISCLVALGQVAAAKREARRILRLHKGFRSIRSYLKAIEDGSFRKPEAWVKKGILGRSGRQPPETCHAVPRQESVSRRGGHPPRGRE